ncbi:hypothetical protein TRFO_29374 [Tritrichomonas foetus]|uniref:Myb-like DNA-binding domain containing protein n=1 Tax=Tritrichomonas foetus TaxID=1144522 RepID=A0A1J4JX93_9EUKA|nr:hypothetical protein TRFO_29374 [Tritrichomonas foetus]|eukprot:OHT03282.1 hypothetical protein TRFO_29374 [Tritrichomonas foetus]
MIGRKKKEKFTPEEDQKLMVLVSQAEKWFKLADKWKVVGHFMENKTPRQCRERYQTYLKPDINHSKWSLAEDGLLRELFQQYGPNWRLMTQFFCGRSNVCIKNRYNYLKRHYGVDIDDSNSIQNHEKKCKNDCKKNSFSSVGVREKIQSNTEEMNSSNNHKCTRNNTKEIINYDQFQNINQPNPVCSESNEDICKVSQEQHDRVYASGKIGQETPVQKEDHIIEKVNDYSINCSENCIQPYLNVVSSPNHNEVNLSKNSEITPKNSYSTKNFNSTEMNEINSQIGNDDDEWEALFCFVFG